MRAVVDMYVHTGYIHVSECVTDGLYWQIGEFCVGNDWSLQQELCNKLLSIQKHFPHMGPWWISKSRTAFSQQRVQSNCIIIINQVKTKNNLYYFTLCFWNVISIALHPLTFNSPPSLLFQLHNTTARKGEGGKTKVRALRAAKFMLNTTLMWNVKLWLNWYKSRTIFFMLVYLAYNKQ
jgi:hypothetical protein